jgi:hypothetical protein
VRQCGEFATPVQALHITLACLSLTESSGVFMPRRMSSIFRLAATVGVAAGAGALTLQLTSKPYQSEQKHPLQAPVIPDAADSRPVYSDGFVGMVGNTPLVMPMCF